MMELDRLRLVGLLLATFAIGACLQDYDEFEVADGDATGATGSGNPSGSGASGDPASGSGASGASGASSSGASSSASTGGTPQCGPCEIPNGEPGCAGSECTIASCNAGYGDCNDMVPDGCETATDANVAHCGDCDRACSAAGVASTACTGGLCTSSCNLGAANCSQPATGPDDGCETNATSTTAHCGGCDNDCSNQGYSGGFVCQNMACRCTTNAQCKGGGNGTVTCDTAAGVCICEGSTCRPGESCIKSGPDQVCRCNGGAGCGANQVCCDNPAGCKDLMTDSTSCGACGHQCATGLSCIAGVCG